MKRNDYGYDTIMTHLTENIDEQYRSVAPPIYLTNNYYFENYQQAMDIVSNKIDGNIYSRHSSPTVDALQKQIAYMEGAESSVATASGLGAIGATFMALLESGDHIIADKVLYGGTRGILKQLEKFDIQVSYVSMQNINKISESIKNNTKIIYCETICNPTMEVNDLKAISEIAKDNKLKFIVDNTFTPPPLAFPIKLGADLVIHSLSKYMSGHSDVMAGVVSGSAEDISIINDFGVALTCGSPISPFSSWQVLRGIKTLGVRMEKHCANALKIAEFLESHPAVASVKYPGLASHKSNKIASELTNGLFGGMLSFIIRDDLKGGNLDDIVSGFFNGVELCIFAASLGEPETLLSHPYRMSHAKMSPEDKDKAGIKPTLLRCSAGLEHPDDIINDLKKSLDKLI